MLTVFLGNRLRFPQRGGALVLESPTLVLQVLFRFDLAEISSSRTHRSLVCAFLVGRHLGRDRALFIVALRVLEDDFPAKGVLLLSELRGFAHIDIIDVSH